MLDFYNSMLTYRSTRMKSLDIIRKLHQVGKIGEKMVKSKGQENYHLSPSLAPLHAYILLNRRCDQHKSYRSISCECQKTNIIQKNYLQCKI